MAKFLVAIALTAFSCLAAPKERAWQDAKVLDNHDTYYFTSTEIKEGVTKDGVKYQNGTMEYSANSGSGIAAVYENYMFESADTVFLVRVARLRTSPPVRVSPAVPAKVAVEKNKFYFLDQAGTEYQATILKQALKQGVAEQIPRKAPESVSSAVPPVPKPAPVAVKALDPVPAAVKPTPKPDPVVVAKQAVPPANAIVRPAPAAAPPPPKPGDPVVVVKQVVPPAPAVVRPAPAAAPPPKTEVKPAPVVKTEPIPQPAPTRTESATHPVKDRAWQSGQLLSTIANSYFLNVNFNSDSDGATWTMVQGNDGRLTLVSQTRPSPGGYTYDNYVIESQFCAYLVQRWRARTSPVARFPGTTPLRFAVEKNKLYVLDETGKEYQTTIIRFVQRDSVDLHTHIVSR